MFELGMPFEMTEEDEEAARVKKEADDMAKKQKEDEEAASRANEAEAAVVLAATSNFTGLTATQMADLFVSFGEQYVGYRDNIIKMDITGALVAQSMCDHCTQNPVLVSLMINRLASRARFLPHSLHKTLAGRYTLTQTYFEPSARSLA